MKTPAGSARKPAKAKPKAETSSSASAPRKRARAVQARSAASSEQASGEAASRLIDQRILDLDGWRGDTLARMRALVLAADPEIIEEWKWRGTPVWSHHGIVCTGESYAKVVKLTFAHGAALPDPAQLFNSSLEGGTRRAIDIREGERVEARAFKALVKAAVARNGSAPAKQQAPARSAARSRPAKAEPKTKLLSGGNPQIAKADGDAPVQAYIAAMPGWKRALGARVDALIARSVPGVRKAVKWNSPLYGSEGQGWFLGLHCFTHYVKLTFFRGAALQPLPPGVSKDKDTRHLDIREGDALDEAQLASWVKQAAALPGWIPGRPPA